MTAFRLGKRTGVARYHQVYTLLSGALQDGSIPAGNALPSELQLMRQYQVSRNTIRHALARLEREGRIVRRQGSGTFACDLGTNDVPLAVTVSGYLDTAGLGSVARTLSYGKAATPAFLLERWPGFGAEALLVKRLWTLQRQPVALCTIHVETTIGADMRRPPRSSTTSIIATLEKTGAKVGHIAQTCRAQNADAVVSEQLGILPGTAVLLLTRWVQDPVGKPLLHQQLAYRSDIYEIASEYSIQSGSHPPSHLASSVTG